MSRPPGRLGRAMMENDDLYGAKNRTLDELRADVAVVLGVAFEPHESLYLGDYFFGGSLNGEHFEILCNNTGFEVGGEEEDNLVEPDFPDHPVLLRINSTMRGDELRARLSSVTGLEFLERG